MAGHGKAARRPWPPLKPPHPADQTRGTANERPGPTASLQAACTQSCSLTPPPLPPQQQQQPMTGGESAISHNQPFGHTHTLSESSDHPASTSSASPVPVPVPNTIMTSLTLPPTHSTRSDERQPRGSYPNETPRETNQSTGFSLIILH